MTTDSAQATTRTAALVLMWIVRVAGVVQILLGLSIWIGVSGRFYSLHIPNGILIVGGLWGLAVLVLLARGRPGLAAFAFLWGLALPVFGLRQAELLVGPWHWIIQVTHLLMGLIALGTADALAKHVLTARTTTAGLRTLTAVPPKIRRTLLGRASSRGLLRHGLHAQVVPSQLPETTNGRPLS